MRTVFARLAAALFGLFLAWLLLEGLLRLMPGLLPPPVQTITGREPRAVSGIDRFYEGWRAAQVSDPLLGVRNAPNLDVLLEGHPDFSYRLRTNSRGLRNERETGPVDAILLGDSFAFGYGVDAAETWQAELRRLSGTEFVNVAVSGMGPVRELRLLETEVLPLQPQLVVWQFFKNDFWDASHFQQWLESDEPDYMAWDKAQYSQPAPSPVTGSGLGWSIRRFLFRHVITYELAKFFLGAGAYADSSNQQVRVLVDGVPLMLEQTLNRTWSDFSRPDIQAGWQMTQESLLQARDQVEAGGASFAVVLVPSKEEAYWRLLAPKLDDPDSMGIGRNSRRMLEFCQAQGIACLDLTSAFQAAAQAGPPLYFTYDAHWNAAGHQLAAEEVYAFLAAENLIRDP